MLSNPFRLIRRMIQNDITNGCDAPIVSDLFDCFFQIVERWGRFTFTIRELWIDTMLIGDTVTRSGSAKFLGRRIMEF